MKRTGEVILKDLKRVFDSAIKPLETMYKYRDLSNRHFGDPEIFSKPLILFMGPWSGGKSTILNYLTENEYTPNSIRSGRCLFISFKIISQAISMIQVPSHLQHTSTFSCMETNPKFWMVTSWQPITHFRGCKNSDKVIFSVLFLGTEILRFLFFQVSWIAYEVKNCPANFWNA